jgi:FtsP/CotA-like multicopper oxidase with cupredoxin domain
MLGKSVMCVLALGTSSLSTAAWTARIREVARAPSAPAPLVRPNPNIERAGVLHDGVLAVTLEAKESAFLIDGSHRPPMTIPAFSEPGKVPLMPGPFVRVPRGTQLRFSVRNSLGTPLTFFVPAALHSGPDRLGADDSVVVPAGDVKTVTTTAIVPGNYVYRATTARGASRRALMEGLLAGAIVIDTTSMSEAPRDRVFVIMQTLDSAFAAYEDTAHAPIAQAPREAGRVVFTINGRSWPDIDRIHATVGDSIHWRVINASSEIHPMHLHGFYYRVDGFTGPLADYQGRPVPGQHVVTQLMSPLSAMSITWSPDRPGNWLFHCHFALHLDPNNSIPAETDDPQMRGMAGLVLGIEVAGRPGVAAVGEPNAVRHLRLIAIADSSAHHGGRADTLPSMRFVLEEHGRRTDTGRDFSPEIDLTRGEPVSITIVNHLAEPTSVHWHGIEVEDSYVDGVPGFSGTGKHLAPEIAPGDSFEARFTPPRSGTFMYHAHMDDVRQQAAGLEGALIVRNRGEVASSDDHVFFLKGQRFNRAHPLEINGQVNPDTVVLHVGQVARFRILNLTTQTPTPTVSLTARPDTAPSNGRDTMIMRWRPVAKDGAALPMSAQLPRAARQIISMGETYDFEFVPQHPGLVQLRVRTSPPPGLRVPPGLLISVPIRVSN